MNLAKITDKSLVTNQDLDFNQRIGLPVEVYCSKRSETIAFGQINAFNDQTIYIGGRPFCRQSNLFFGQPCLTA